MIPTLLAMILISIPLSVLGVAQGITAAYVQEPYLMFKNGGDGDPYQGTQLVGLLGTMELDHQDQESCLVVSNAFASQILCVHYPCSRV